MTRILKKRSRKSGLPPGSLVHIGNHTSEKIILSAMDYDAQHVQEHVDASLSECLAYLGTPTTTWINVRGIHDVKMIESIGRQFGLHPLLLEDIANSGQRSKLDDYKDSIFIVMRLLNYNWEKRELEDEQVSMVLGKNYLISFIEKQSDIFKPVRDRILNKNSRITQQGADYLCYALIDTIVDNYFVNLEQFDENLDLLEKSLVKQPEPVLLQQIQHTKREIALLRKCVWPVREVVNQFRRMETPLIKDSTKLYMQDVYDHTIQAIDTIESFRDISSGLLDIYLSNISFRLNEIMKVLTIVATIFAPATFLASLYGMNFKHMPELDTEWGYPILLAVMALISLGMLYYFHRKKWL